MIEKKEKQHMVMRETGEMNERGGKTDLREKRRGGGVKGERERETLRWHEKKKGRERDRLERKEGREEQDVNETDRQTDRQRCWA